MIVQHVFTYFIIRLLYTFVKTSTLRRRFITHLHKKEDAELLPIHRQQTLLEWLKEEGPLKISDISERFGVSEMTVYRDVNQLADANRIIRILAALRSRPLQNKAPINAAIACGRFSIHILFSLLPFHKPLSRCAAFIARFCGMRIKRKKCPTSFVRISFSKRR